MRAHRRLSRRSKRLLDQYRRQATCNRFPRCGAWVMLELILCSMITVFPDYLFRRYVQGKRIGRELTMFSVWFELRWGITACVLLTITLITVIFYYHPSTKSAILFFRAVSILPEGSGRVEKVYIGVREKVKAGQPLFKLDSSEQERSEEHTSEIQSLMRISYAVFCLKKKTQNNKQ